MDVHLQSSTSKIILMVPLSSNDWSSFPAASPISVLGSKTPDRNQLMPLFPSVSQYPIQQQILTTSSLKCNVNLFIVLHISCKHQFNLHCHPWLGCSSNHPCSTTVSQRSIFPVAASKNLLEFNQHRTLCYFHSNHFQRIVNIILNCLLTALRMYPRDSILCGSSSALLF